MRTARLFFLFCLLAGFLVSAPAQPAHASGGAVAPDAFLNPNGTLNLDGRTNAALDLAGYNVTLDPALGPVFSQANAPAIGQWDSLGGGGSALNGVVYAVEMVGTDIYVGGNFTNAGGVPEADYVAMWDGTAWHSLGTDGNGGASIQSDGAVVYALDFDGNYLYVGGAFQDVNDSGTVLDAADYIARWDGGNWSSLGSIFEGVGPLDGAVRSIANDGGQYVYVGGEFSSVQNNGTWLPAPYVARWDGTDWAALGNNAINGIVYSVAVSSLNANLYVGGDFIDAAGILAADYIAQWNGSAWSALGSNGAGDGAFDTVFAVYAIATDYLGNVYVGGNFVDVNNGAANLPEADYLVKWNGSAWSAVGTSGNIPSINGIVRDLSVDLSNNLYAAGEFTDVTPNGVPLPAADKIAKWNPAANGGAGGWSAYGFNGLSGAFSGSAVIYSIARDGSGLYVGGDFSQVSDEGSTLAYSTNFVQWNPAAHSGAGGWAAVDITPNGSISRLPPYSPNMAVDALAVMGTDVYVGGSFETVANQGYPVSGTNYIARWDGSNWSAVGGGLNGEVYSLYVNGTDLYAGGYFTSAGGDPSADYLAKWDGSAWSAIGSDGAGNGSLKSGVQAITMIGTDLYAGGIFINVVDVNGAILTAADYIARWDGSHWHALDGGSGVAPLTNSVYALETDGANLYAGGYFANAGGIAQADFIAKWNPAANSGAGGWAALGSNAAGTNGALTGDVFALRMGGSNLYVGGYFANAGGIAQADCIAKWNPAANSGAGGWSALGSNTAGTDGALLGNVWSIAYINGNVYAGGYFFNAGEVPQADYLAKFDGSNWSALGSDGGANGSLNDSVQALLFDGSALYVGGWFTNVNNGGTILKTADYVAVYGEDVSPSVVSIVRTNANPSNSATVQFTVTFSEIVSGVDTGDFTLTTSRVNSASISSVPLSINGLTYDVVVNSGSGNGSIRLDLADNNTIVDLTSNPLGGDSVGDGNFSSGETYTMIRTVTFADVPLAYWSNFYIERLYNAGITGGCSVAPLNYCPTNSVTRAQMAVFLLRGMHGSAYTPPAATGSMFTDVSTGTFGAAWIEELANEGITSGCGGGKFCPNTIVTRAQMAVFLVRAKHGVAFVPPAATGIFSDVPVGSFGANYIEQLVADAVTSGCGGGLYCPATTVKRDSMAVFLVKNFNLP